VENLVPDHQEGSGEMVFLVAKLAGWGIYRDRYSDPQRGRRAGAGAGL